MEILFYLIPIFILLSVGVASYFLGKITKQRLDKMAVKGSAVWGSLVSLLFFFGGNGIIFYLILSNINFGR